MTLLNLRHKGKSIGVVFPTTVNAVNKAVTELKRGYAPAGTVRITDADSPIQNLVKYITCADPENEADIRKQVLRRVGADDEIIDTIDGYMDFEKFGEDSMAEDGVRRTEYGLIRCCSHPFPEETQGQQIGGM